MIRKGTFDDAAGIADIFNHYIESSTAIFSNRLRSADDIREQLTPVVGHYPFYIAEEDGVITGYCYAHAFHPDPVYSATWEITIYLHHNYTGRGTGRRLLESVISEARIMGAHTLVSCITDGNEACERLHKGAGFERVGVIRDAGYKFGLYLNDVFYQKIL